MTSYEPSGPELSPEATAANEIHYRLAAKLAQAEARIRELESGQPVPDRDLAAVLGENTDLKLMLAERTNAWAQAVNTMQKVDQDNERLRKSARNASDRVTAKSEELSREIARTICYGIAVTKNGRISILFETYSDDADAHEKLQEFNDPDYQIVSIRPHEYVEPEWYE